MLRWDLLVKAQEGHEKWLISCLFYSGQDNKRNLYHHHKSKESWGHQLVYPHKKWVRFVFYSDYFPVSYNISLTNHNYALFIDIR